MTAATAPSASPRTPNTLSTLKAMIGRRIRYETRQGTIRTGRLTDVRTHKISLGGNPYELPHELICDRDETDATAVCDVIKIDVLPAAGE